MYSRACFVVISFFMICTVLFLGRQSLAGGVYEKSCARCHDSGILDAPMPASDDLQQRLKIRGSDGLYESLLNGRARMPKRGGCFSCTDDELRQVLESMLQRAKN